MSDQNELKKITDANAILSLLQTAKDEVVEAYVWKLISGVRHMGQIKLEVVRKLRNDFCIIPADGQDKQVQDLLSSVGSIDLYIPSSSLLFRCLIKKNDGPSRYYLEIPKLIAQTDRRLNLRLGTYETGDVKITFAKTIPQAKPITQHFIKSCFDLSVGGYSFLISKPELKFFVIDQDMSAVGMKATGWASKINSKIVSIRELEPDASNGLNYKAWRVSCAFSDLDHISKKYIEKYVFERIKEELRVINE